MDVLPRYSRFIMLAAAWCWFAMVPMQAQETPGQPPSPEQPPASKGPSPSELAIYEKLLKKLEQMQEKREADLNNAIVSLQSELRKLISNPRAAVKAYEDAVEYARYEGKPNGDDNFEKWQKRRETMHRDRMFEEAISLQLQYLLLSMELQKGDDPMKQREFLMGQIMQYMDKLQNWEEKLIEMENPPTVRERVDVQKRLGGVNIRELRNTLKENLNTSPFVKQYRLDDHLKLAENWEATPGNLDGIMTQNVMWFLREREDPRLFQMWQRRIQYREKRAKLTQSQATMDSFEKQVKPALLWAMSQDMINLGSKSQGVTQMMAILEQHPDHANFERWSGELIGVLRGEINSVVKPPAPTADAPPPPAAPDQQG